MQHLNAQGAGLFGGGSLISAQHVLTAGQVVSGFVTWNVALGSKRFNELRQIQSIVAHLHPEYNAVSRNNDIGVIVLSGAPVIFSGKQRSSQHK